MHIGAIVIASVIVLTGLFYRQISSRNSTSQTADEQDVLSEETSNEEDVENTISLTPTNPPNSPTSAPTNTSTPTINNSSINNYMYPNSSVVSSSNNFLSLTSEDSADVITDWYKNKIDSEGMNVTSFVTTNTNDNVLNKLVGADGTYEVSVEISKISNSSTVHIEVSI